MLRHESRAVTLKLREPQKKCPKAVLTHLHGHVAWSQILKSTVELYVIGLSTKYYFNECLFMWVLAHHKIE